MRIRSVGSVLVLVLTALGACLRGEEIVLENVEPTRSLPAGAIEYSGAIPLQTRVALSPDGSRGVTIGGDNTIRVWDTTKTKPIAEHKTENGPYGDLSFAMDGKSVITAGTDHFLRQWDIETGKQIRAFEGHASEIRSVATSPDGRRIASADSSGVIRIWDIETGKEVTQLTGQHAEVRIDALSFGPDGKTLLSEAMDESAHLWNPILGESLRKLPEHDNSVAALALSPDGVVGASTRLGGMFRIWDVATGNVIHAIRGHSDAVCCLAFTADGRWLLTGSHDRTLRQWDVTSGTEIRRFKLVSVPQSVAVAPDGRWAVTVSQSEGWVRWDLTKAPLFENRQPGGDFEACWHNMAVDYDSRAVAIATLIDKKAPIADVVKKLTARLEGHVAGERNSSAKELIGQLDDANFTIRERAFQDLKSMGATAREDLQAAQSHASAEVRTRVAALLAGMAQGDPRLAACAEVLALLGTPEAKSALEMWAAKRESAFAPYARAVLARK